MHTLAITELSVYYHTNQNQLNQILDKWNSTLKAGNKMVFVGCGKSLKIICKNVAMLNSMGMPAVSLHPSEAMHGDIGIIHPDDCIIVCSSSGETEELILFMDYLAKYEHMLHSNNYKVVITSHEDSKLSKQADDVLYVPQNPRYKETFFQKGLKAPTISTTLMLIVLDCAILTLSELYFEGDLKKRNRAFNIRHPGGGIGKESRDLQSHLLGPPTQDSVFAKDDVPILHDKVSEQEFLTIITMSDYCKLRNHIYPSMILKEKYRKYNGRFKKDWPHFLSTL